MALKEITDRISEMEFEMITARMDRKLPSREKIGNILVYRVGFGFSGLDKFLLAPLGFFKALSLNKRKNYDAIWSMMASQASVAAACFKKACKGKKLVLTLQEGDEEEHLKRYVLNINILYRVLIRPWHMLVFKRADIVTAISADLKERAVKNKIGCQIQIIPNGVDVEEFSKNFTEQELNELKSKLSKKPEDKFIIHTGRSVLKNAVDDIIKSLKFLPDNIKFLAVGTGPDDENLKKMAKSLRLGERVIFAGFVGQKEMIKYLKVSDVFVRPSLSEGLGNSFLEAMAAGIPVIGTPVGGIPDFLKDGQTGLFCKVRDPESIAEKIKIIFENSVLRQNLIKNAKELVFKNYDWKLVAQKMEAVLIK